MARERMVIPVSFLDKDDYLYVKNMPNSSWYIRQLVKMDRDMSNKTNNYNNSNENISHEDLDNTINPTSDEDLKNNINNMFKAFN